MTPNYFDAKSTAWDDDKKIERAKIVYTRMTDFIKADSKKKLLDFGSGTGLLGFNFIHDFNEVHFADTSQGMLEKVSAKADAAQVENYKTLLLPEDGLNGAQFAEYKAVVTLLAFHHVENIRAALTVLAAHTEKDGFLAVSDLDIEDGSFHAPMKVPHNGIDRSEILSFMENSGLEVLCNETVYTDERIIDGAKKEYPIFLIIGKKTR
ncbi:MAG: methyltransferase [Treponema sp.]